MDLAIALFIIIILVFSAVIHEFSHGWMADRLGDPTAKYMGRLTLNPIPHIDLLGSIIFPMLAVFLGPILFGKSVILAWAKPVPYNPYNLRDKKNGEILVAFAGPLSNLLIALIFGIFIRVLIIEGIKSSVIIFFGLIVFYNIFLAIFNLFPIVPLDGSKILFHFLPYSMHNVKEFMERNFMFIFLIMFFVFNGFVLILLVVKVLFVLMTGSRELLSIFV